MLPSSVEVVTFLQTNFSVVFGPSPVGKLPPNATICLFILQNCLANAHKYVGENSGMTVYGIVNSKI